MKKRNVATDPTQLTEPLTQDEADLPADLLYMAAGHASQNLELAQFSEPEQRRLDNSAYESNYLRLTESIHLKLDLCGFGESPCPVAELLTR
jgi:hypothetical protein